MWLQLPICLLFIKVTGKCQEQENKARVNSDSLSESHQLIGSHPDVICFCGARTGHTDWSVFPLSFLLFVSLCLFLRLSHFPLFTSSGFRFSCLFCTNSLWYPLYLHFVSFYLVSSTETTPFSLNERMLMKSQILEQEFVLMLEIILFPVLSSYMSLWSHKKGKWVLFMSEQHNTL